jgi:hypothetical protein
VRIEIRIAQSVLAASLALVAGGAMACGHCIEDREAAVYDHAVIENALARHHKVVFFAIQGEIRTDEASRRALVAALEGGGGDRRTARVALPSAACSVAYDPARISIAQLAARANKALAGQGLTLGPLRVTSENDGLVEAK